MRSSRMMGLGHSLVIVVLFSAIATIATAYDYTSPTPQYDSPIHINISPYPPKKYSPYPSHSPPPQPQYRRQGPKYVPHPKQYVYSSPPPPPYYSPSPKVVYKSSPPPYVYSSPPPPPYYSPSPKAEYKSPPPP
ncbi:hypothetical protein V5N11_012413 [Cardamine amara subsp. amara]|uniref:Extensin n=1 Tax=Cardamine amara subsp. amara TaxID=228776 RepID=A0ABD0ZYF1_CARAN